MASKSDFLEDALLNYAFRGSPTPFPGTPYIGLWTASLSDVSTGSTAGEVSGAGYARQPLVRGTADWTVSSGGTIKNAGTINFGTAGANWGTVTDFAVCDALTVGNILYWGTLGTSKIISNGDSATWAGSALVITEG